MKQNETRSDNCTKRKQEMKEKKHKQTHPKSEKEREKYHRFVILTASRTLKSKRRQKNRHIDGQPLEDRN